MKKLFGLVLCVFFVFASCKTKDKPEVKPKAPEPKSALAKIETMRTKSASEVRSFIINERTKTAVLVLPVDHDFVLPSIKPAITVSKGASVSPGSDVEQDFSSGKTVSYTVTAENGETNTYIASVKVLGPRNNLNVDSIFICGEKVENNKVTIPAQYSFVEKKDIMVNFTGEDVPVSFNMSEEKVILNKKGESRSITLSTMQTDKWNAWSSPSITITRGDIEQPLSSEKKILDFYISFNVDDDEGSIINKSNIKCDIDEVNKKISYILPVGSLYETIKTNIRCSTGALLIPPVGEIDFKQSVTTPIVYTVKAADGSTQTYNVSIGRTKSSNAKIKSFVVPGNGRTFMGNIDEANRKISVEVRGDLVDITNIKPKITISNDATVNPTSDETKDFSNSMSVPIPYTVTAENGNTRTYNVSIKVLSAEANIISFSLNVGGIDRPCLINGTDIKLPAPLPIGTDVKALVPTIVVSNGAKVVPGSGVSQSFIKPVKYTVTAEDKFTKKEYIATIEVEKSHEAKILEFSIDEKSCDDINHTLGTILIWVSDDKDVKALRPKIKVSDGAKVTPESGKEQDFTNPVPYKVTAEDGTTEKTYTVTVKKGKSNEAKIKKFSIGGVNGSIDEGTKKIFVGLPTGSALTGLTPTVKVSGGASYEPKGAQDFTNSTTTPVLYTVTAENGTTQVIYSVTVKVVSNEAKITQFSVNSTNAKSISHPSGATHGQILVVLPAGSALTGVTPTVAVSGGASYEPKGAQDFTNSTTTPIPYTVTAENGVDRSIYDVVVRCIASEAKITRFMIGNVEGTIDTSQKEILVKLAPDAPLTNITPKVTVSIGATYTPKDAQDFTSSMSSPINYNVTSEDGSKTETYKVRVRNISKKAKITEFKIGSVLARINHTKLTVIAEVEHTVSLATITPTIKISEYAKVSPESNTLQDFTGSLTKPKLYKVTAEDGTEATYRVSIMQKSKAQRYTVHGKAVTPGLTVTVPNSVTSIEASDIKAWFTDSGNTEHSVPAGKIMVEIESGDITQNNAEVVLVLTILPFENFAGLEVRITLTKQD